MTPEELARKAKAKMLLTAKTQSRMIGRRGMPTSEMAFTAADVHNPFRGYPPNWRSDIWPASADERGNLQFDPTAGIPGNIWNSLTLPSDVLAGKASPHDPETQQRVTGLAMLATGIPPASRMLRTVPRQLTPKPPTAKELKVAGAAGFERARGMNVDYSSAAVKTMADDIQRSFEENGILAELAPKTFAILRKLQEPPEGSVASLDGLIAARRSFQNIAGGIDPTERLAARDAIRQLDEFIARSGADPTDLQPGVVAGPAQNAARVLAEARGNYAAAKRSERVTKDKPGEFGALERAELNASVANSGLNTGNQIRQRLRDLLTRPKSARGYSKEELAFIEQVVRGKFGSNLARYAGNLLGGGGGLGQAMTTAGGAALGAATGGAPGAAVGATILPMAGAASRHLYNRMVRGQLANLDEMIRKRSPLYERLAKTAPLAATNPDARAAFLRTLLLMFGVSEQATPPLGGQQAP